MIAGEDESQGQGGDTAHLVGHPHGDHAERCQEL
jgi:hypothetical protein